MSNNPYEPPKTETSRDQRQRAGEFDGVIGRLVVYCIVVFVALSAVASLFWLFF